MSGAVSMTDLAEDKVQAILNGLKAGKTREVLAEELDYANHRSLDMMMRRHNYVWYKQEQMYYRLGQEIPTVKPIEVLHERSQATHVLQLLQQGMDARLVAEKAGFTTYREMANFMKENGYAWDAQENNYAFSTEQAPGDSRETRQSRPSRQTEDSTGTMEHSINRDWQQYLPSLQWLSENRELLEDLIASTDSNQDNVGGVIPRYAVPGVFVTKSVHMSNQLDQLVRDFSVDRNISQRDVFAAALLEFLRKYGYKQEVEVFLAVH